MAFPFISQDLGLFLHISQSFIKKKKSTYKDWEETNDLLFEGVLLLMSASKCKQELRGAGNGKGGGKG